jgi:DNA-binding transcriptional LysR family regulator
MKVYEVDVCIISGTISDSNFSYIPLDNDSLAVAVSNDNPISNFESISLQKLKEEKLILRSKNQIHDFYLNHT